MSAQIQELGASAPAPHPFVQFTLWFPKEAQVRAAFDEMGNERRAEYWFEGMGGDDSTEWGFISDFRCSKKAEADQLYLESLSARYGGECVRELDADTEDHAGLCECAA
jgi:hypothetical protein